jgi:hypothetical protein
LPDLAIFTISLGWECSQSLFVLRSLLDMYIM